MTEAEFSPPPSGADHVGARLRAAREAAGKSLADIADQTKVPVRLLDAIERGAVGELPTGPYAIGFVRTYARAVGADDQQAIDDMRELLHQHSAGTVAATTYYEPADADRVPPRMLAWVAAGIALLLVIAYVIWRMLASSPDTPPPATPAGVEQQADAGAPGSTPADGVVAQAPLPAPTVVIAEDAPVRIAASERTWFSLTDASGRGQFDLTLNGGEFYTVRPNQRGLFLRTDNPQSLRLVVGDRSIPLGGAADVPANGVGLDTDSLSRLAGGQAGASGPAPSTAASRP